MADQVRRSALVVLLLILSTGVLISAVCVLFAVVDFQDLLPARNDSSLHRDL